MRGAIGSLGVYIFLMYKEWSSVLAARVFVILFGLDVLVFMWQTRDRHLVVDTRVGDAYRTEGADMRFGTRPQKSLWNRETLETQKNIVDA